MLAKNSQAPLSFSKHALSLTIFASKLAPTVGDDRLTDWHCGLPAIAADGNHDAKRAALDLALDLLLILSAPLNHAGRNSTGIWGVNRQGCRFSRPAPRQWICTQSNCVDCQAVFAGKPAPTFGSWAARELGAGCQAVTGASSLATGPALPIAVSTATQ